MYFKTPAVLNFTTILEFYSPIVFFHVFNVWWGIIFPLWQELDALQTYLAARLMQLVLISHLLL